MLSRPVDTRPTTSRHGATRSPPTPLQTAPRRLDLAHQLVAWSVRRGGHGCGAGRSQARQDTCRFIFDVVGGGFDASGAVPQDIISASAARWIAAAARLARPAWWSRRCPTARRCSRPSPGSIGIRASRRTGVGRPACRGRPAHRPIWKGRKRCPGVDDPYRCRRVGGQGWLGVHPGRVRRRRRGPGTMRSGPNRPRPTGGVMGTPNLARLQFGMTSVAVTWLSRTPLGLAGVKNRRRT